MNARPALASCGAARAAETSPIRSHCHEEISRSRPSGLRSGGRRRGLHVDQPASGAGGLLRRLGLLNRGEASAGPRGRSRGTSFMELGETRLRS